MYSRLPYLISFLGAASTEGVAVDALNLLQLDSRITAKSSSSTQGNDTDPSSEWNRPNVLFMIADDFGGEMQHLGGKVYTPNLDELAQSSVSFPMAYSHHPICAPSRASLLYGIYGFHSGFDWFEAWYRNPVLQGSSSIMEHFKNNGYETFGRGKMFHPGATSNGRELADQLWTELQENRPDYGPFAWNQAESHPVPHPGIPAAIAVEGPLMSYGRLEDAPPGGWMNDNRTQYVPGQPTYDDQTADWAVAKLHAIAATPWDQRKPFLLMLGFMKPHFPLHVSADWFGKVQDLVDALPEAPEGDIDDTHFHAWFADAMQEQGETDSYMDFEKAGGNALLNAYWAYLAAKANVDADIGKVINALKATEQFEKTIIVFTSDHGFHFGEKKWVGKWTPYETSTRVPLIIRAPGVTQAGSQPAHPVGLIDVFTTLNDLCSLSQATRKNDRGHSLDGHSLRPLLENSGTTDWTGPEGVISLLVSDCDVSKYALSLRTKQHRYVLYSDQSEELYDHANDPREYTNLLFTANRMQQQLVEGSDNDGEDTVMKTRDQMRQLLLGVVNEEAFKRPYYKGKICIPEKENSLSMELQHENDKQLLDFDEEYEAVEHVIIEMPKQ